jgi:hypothetical protein
MRATPAKSPVIYGIPVAPVPHALPGSSIPTKNLASCEDAAGELRAIANPKYDQLTGDVRFRAEDLLSTLGERCDGRTAHASMTELHPWLTGTGDVKAKPMRATARPEPSTPKR